MPPWLQFFLASEGSKMITPRTSYGVPKPVAKSPIENPAGPSAGYQRPVAEGYKMPKSGTYKDIDAGIRGEGALALPAYMAPQYTGY